MPKRRATAPASRDSAAAAGWESLPDDALLDLKFSDLGLTAQDSELWPDVERLYRELENRGLRFRPHVWLSESWFSPDGVPGIAAPFFAAHPRLRRLERRLIGEAEGGSGRWRRQLLRHEAGHAIDTAYGLRRRADFRRVFGRASEPYPRVYRVRPASRDHVLHLGQWYAQSHPTEDFAETFAVWLEPRARWRREYSGWPALAKLEYVDALMAELAGAKPRNRSRAIVAPLARNPRTLRSHYRRKLARYAGTDDRYDAWLEQVLVPVEDRAAAAARRRVPRASLRRALIERGAHPYLVEHALRTVARRAFELGLGPPAGAAAERRLVELHRRIIDDVLQRNLEHFAR